MMETNLYHPAIFFQHCVSENDSKSLTIDLEGAISH